MSDAIHDLCERHLDNLDAWDRKNGHPPSSRSEWKAKVARLETALRAIIERAENGTLGTSKVQDMKRIALEALNKE